jgi:hypothetical protein
MVHPLLEPTAEHRVTVFAEVLAIGRLAIGRMRTITIAKSIALNLRIRSVRIPIAEIVFG